MWTVYCILCGGPPHRLSKRDLHPVLTGTGLRDPGIDYETVATPPQWAEPLFRRPNSTFLKTIRALLVRNAAEAHFSFSGIYTDCGVMDVNVDATPDNVAQYPEVSQKELPS